ncbi:DUF445 family protein [uncultured Clostridium sp.]|jgi:uncharacterized membrane protein YheB (UPF0754 family)|uniref:DUF445 family protein n=1 Tax=uncultured Clostridium sp. TaxID=59620 RepID=UPI00261D73FC|nr:DUF445 family protein [uncultured Clostridium sp.]
MPYIVGALIGAIIGYFTNWLAIKMLFKPHTEKRIAGMKVPFTPGLIPKEKTRIAKSVAQSVGEHLINQESIGKTLNKPEVKDKVKSALDDKALQILEKEGTLEERLRDMFKESYSEKEIIIEEKIYSKTMSIIEDKEKQNKLAGIATNFIKNKLAQEPSLIIKCLEKADLKLIVDKISKNIDSQSSTELIAENIDKIIDNLEASDKTVKDYIPTRAFDAVEKMVYDNKEVIIKEICDTLKNPDVSDKIKKAILGKVLGGLGGMIAMFVSVDGIYDKFVVSVEEYLEEPENADELCKYIVSYINKLAGSNISDVIKKLPAGISVDLAVSLSDKIGGLLTDGNNIEKLRAKLISFVSECKSYDELIVKFDADYEVRINGLVATAIEKLAQSEDIKSGLRVAIKAAKTELLSYEINKDDNSKKEIITGIDGLFETNYEKFIENDLQGVIELIDIQSIVEEQINAFEVDEAEKIILGIASKELSAITWLGAVLGAILGILSPLLSSLYM